MKLLVLTLLLSGCAINDILPVNYKFGDVSRLYCMSNNPYEKAQLKVIIKSTGLTVGVDYCLKAGIAEMIIGNKE